MRPRLRVRSCYPNLMLMMLSLALSPRLDVLSQQATDGLEQVMLAQDKLYVVLAVVLLIWLGLLLFLFRTDRKLSALERTLEERIPPQKD